VSSTRSYLSIVFFVLLGCQSHKIANYKGGSLSVDYNPNEDGLDSLISPYRDSMTLEMNTVIGKASTDLEKYTPESPLGNFAAEATFLAGYQIGINSNLFDEVEMEKSLCLLNFGGLRSSIQAGDISLGNIFELMPFDNTLVLLKVSGESMKECAKYLFDVNGQPIFNATFRLTNHSESMTIGGESYDFEEEVVIMTTNYLADGGDKMSFLLNPILKYDTGILLRDIFIDFIKEKKELGTFQLRNKFQLEKD
jgi:2',3'-cyclic-nucleotide 2'-phosphodiesterase (5'-nucleotidase family)